MSDPKTPARLAAEEIVAKYMDQGVVIRGPVWLESAIERAILDAEKRGRESAFAQMRTRLTRAIGEGK